MISKNLITHSLNQSLDDDWDRFVPCVATESSLDDECISNYIRERGEFIYTERCFDISRLADCLQRKCWKEWWSYASGWFCVSITFTKTRMCWKLLFFKWSLTARPNRTSPEKPFCAFASPPFLVSKRKFNQSDKSSLYATCTFCRLVMRVNKWKDTPVRWAEGWRCQNSTVSGSGSAEQLLWCPGRKDSWVQFFSALVEHCMLGRLRHGGGFSRFNEGSRPVGKKETCENYLWVFLTFYHRCNYIKCLCPVGFIPSILNSHRYAPLAG